MFTPIGFFAPQGGGVITANLEQWLDVTQGSEAGALLDQSGNSRNATNSGLTWDSGNNWWYVSSNTDWTKCIETNYRFTNFAAVSWTAECWVNMNTILGDNYIGLIHDRDDARNRPVMEISMGGPTNAKPVAAMESSTAGNEITCFNAPDTYQDEWILLTTTYEANYSGTTDRLRLYVNGVLQDTGTATMSAVDDSQNIRLYGGYVRSIFWIENAKFGSYRLYSTALSSDDILQNFDAEKSHYGL